MTRHRRAGMPWRILVHDWLGNKGVRDTGSRYGQAHEASSDPTFGGGGPATAHDVVWPGTEFDELVIGSWIHLEQMDTGRWWMNIGGVTVWVQADSDGKPTAVSVFGPADYDTPVDGCAYTCDWTDPAPAKPGKRRKGRKP